MAIFAFFGRLRRVFKQYAP